MQYGCELHRRLVVSSKNNRKILKTLKVLDILSYCSIVRSVFLNRDRINRTITF